MLSGKWRPFCLGLNVSSKSLQLIRSSGCIYIIYIYIYILALSSLSYCGHYNHHHYLHHYHNQCHYYYCFTSMENLDKMFDTGLFINDLSMHDSSRDLVLAGTQQQAELKMAMDQEKQKSSQLENVLKKMDKMESQVLSLLTFMGPRTVSRSVGKGESLEVVCQVREECMPTFWYKDRLSRWRDSRLWDRLMFKMGTFVLVCQHLSSETRPMSFGGKFVPRPP